MPEAVAVSAKFSQSDAPWDLLPDLKRFQSHYSAQAGESPHQTISAYSSDQNYSISLRVRSSYWPRYSSTSSTSLSSSQNDCHLFQDQFHDWTGCVRLQSYVPHSFRGWRPIP